MRIEKRIYKVFYKGKQYSLPLSVFTRPALREKVRVRSSKLNASAKGGSASGGKLSN